MYKIKFDGWEIAKFNLPPLDFLLVLFFKCQIQFAKVICDSLFKSPNFSSHIFNPMSSVVTWFFAAINSQLAINQGISRAKGII